MDAKTQDYVEMMKLWLETAKGLTQIALAALILPVFFLRDILGVAAGSALRPHLNAWLIASWASFMVAIVCGTVYQMTAARLIGDAYSGTVTRPLFPHLQFRLLISALFLGLACFLGAVLRAPGPIEARCILGAH
jgi:hypothetical protein